MKNKLTVLQKVNTIQDAKYTYNVLGEGGKYLHINDHKGNHKSIIVPLSSIKKLLEGE